MTRKPAYLDPDAPANGPLWHTGKPCIEAGCDEPAGTAWSPYWCQRHNAERLDRVSAGFAAAEAALLRNGPERVR